MAEKLYPIVTAIRMATGQIVCRQTANRWARVGVRGIKLRSWMLGGRRLSTIPAAKEFVDLMSDEDFELPVMAEVAAR